MNSDTFRPPVGNMGPMAEPWRRWAQEQVITNAEAIERLGGDATNDGRANNSQMDLMASQINELYQRQSSLTLDDGFNSGPMAPLSTVNVSKTIQLPRPTDVTRNGWLSITLNGAQNTANDFSTMYISLYCDNVLFHRNSINFPVGGSTPVGWRDFTNVTGYTGFRASPTDGGSLRIEMIAVTNAGGGTRTLTISDIRITSQFSQRV